MKTFHPFTLAFGTAVALATCVASSAPTPATGGSPETTDTQPLVLDIARFCPERFVKNGETNANFQAITGRQVFDGLPFQVQGCGELYGRQQARRTPDASHPDFIGIQVGRKFEELHMLHEAHWADVEGETIALIRLNYADGTTHELPIRYGGHVRDWQRLRSEEKELLTDPNSKIIWRGAGKPEYKATQRLFKSMLPNPFPQKVVTTLDILSARHLASYELVAATVAMCNPNRAITPAVPPGEPERHFDGAVMVHVRDQISGQPITNALVNPSMNVDDTGVIASPLYTSANGEAMVRYPSEQTSSLYVSVEKTGYGLKSATANLSSGITNEIEIELRPVPTLAGFVRRPDGQPAAGLNIRIIGPNGEQGTTPTTDANGKFDAPYASQPFGRSDQTSCLLIRDVEHNLAVAQDIDEDTGPLDLRLAPGVTLAGRAEIAGKPITNATAALVFWTGSSGMHLQGMAVRTNIPGQFEIPALPPGRRYGLYVSAPGYGQKYVNAEEVAEDAKRIELGPVELKPANLKLAGQVVDVDDKPVAGANVYLGGEGQPSGNVRTDQEGRFNFKTVCEGSVHLSANAKNSHGSISAEGGDTNVLVKLGESPNYSSGATVRKLGGFVTSPDGQPAVGVEVAVFPEPSNRRKTGTNGNFSLNWTIQPWQLQQGGDPWLVARDTAHNLAAAETVSEDNTNLNVRLKPGLVVTGRVEGPDGVALTNAQVAVWLLACRSYSHLSEQPAHTDSQGNFEIKTLPQGPDYIVYATAKDHGRQQQKLEAESNTNRIEMPPFVLGVADQVIAGQVLNAQEKPASGVQVSLSGEGQPDGNTTTDSNGRFNFKVCVGQIQLYAYASSAFANATAAAGDTNIVIQLRSNRGMSVRSTPKRPSLKGKPLPDLATFGLAADAVPEGKPLLLCLLDAEQRPSRRSVRLLANQQAALAQKGIAVLAIQAVATSAEPLQSWTNSTPLPFPLGCITETSPATKWATSVESLPWFILRDAKGNVAAEGFALDELDAKLATLSK